MTDLSLARLKRTRAGRAVKRLVRRTEAVSTPRPVLSVVVTFHDSVRLRACLESLAAQTQPGIELVLVDDGSTDGASDIARHFADSRANVVLVRRAHAGVGAARNAGVELATGTYLAFCDSDDEVPPGGYERLVRALEESGSDFAFGSASLQQHGVYQEPTWARRSNADRRLRVTLEQVPAAVANLLPGTRVFRRSFWDAHGLSFTGDDHSDIVIMVRAMLAAKAFDILPAVVYRWGWREDGRSLLQRDLREKDRVSNRIASIRKAGELLVAEASPEVGRQFFVETLHASSEFVRAAVCRDDGYWEALVAQMRLLMDGIPPETLAQVPVEDRIIGWLCARNERAATEEFLEYAFDNLSGYPFREVDGRAHISLPFIDALSAADDDLTRVADTDLRYRTRLSEMAWVRPGVLSLEGAAFIEYVDDAVRPGTVTLVLRDRRTRVEHAVPARMVHDRTVNRWANRAQEDHANAAFEAEIDIATLPRSDDTPAVFDVSVRLERDGSVRVAPFQARRGAGSAGLLEPSVVDGLAGVPSWRALTGLALTVRAARPTDQPSAEQTKPVMVDRLDGNGDVVELSGTGPDGSAIALVGPRTRTPWAPLTHDGDSFTVTISVLVDEWGLGATSLPIDDYAVVARLADGAEVPVGIHADLWRHLPLYIDAGTHLFHPNVVDDGELTLRVTPGEFRDSVGAYVRRRLRDVFYPEAREKPLADVALFETFAGKAAGDNPGPLCEELAARETDLDLVFSVVDRSVVVPDGARAVVRWSPEWFELLGRARYLVTNAPLPPFFRKRAGQVFLHTWHGSPLKRIAHDRTSMDFPNWHHRRQLLSSRDDWDFLLSQSPFCTEALRSAFRYDGEVLELGYPRNDLLRSADAAEIRRRTRAHLGIAEDTRVILYAPTWRDNQRAGRVFNKVIYLDSKAVVDRVPNSVVLMRGHYNTIGAADQTSVDPRILDVTRYPDISHLYLAADALVTDYSSVFFDFVLTDRPMFFLAPDLVEYRDENRGFYLDYHDTVPGPVTVTTDEVIDLLNGPDRHDGVRERFRARFTPLDDGGASRRVIDAMLRRGEAVAESLG